MKILFIGMIGLISSIQSFGQSAPSIRLSEEIISAMIDSAMSLNPQIKAFKARREQAELSRKRVARDWLDDIIIGTQYNSLYDAQEEKYSFVPRAGLGFSLSLGSIINQGIDTKIATKELELAIANEENIRNWVRTEVKSRLYQFYKVYNTHLFHIELRESSKLSFIIAEEKYKNGEIDYEEYHKSFSAYADNKERAIVSEAELLSSKGRLEELIGSISNFDLFTK